MNEKTFSTLELYKKFDEITLSKHQNENLSLLKCIQTYRIYPNVEDLINRNPHLVSDLNEIYKLWSKFKTMDETKLAELAINLLNELDNKLI